MRLRHTEPTLQTPVHAAPPTESTVPSLPSHRQSSPVTATTPTSNVSQAYSKGTKAISPFPSVRTLIKAAAVGLGYGAFTCLMLLEVPALPYFGINTPPLLGPFASRLLLARAATLFLLSLLLAFRLGWQERHGIRGAVGAVVFGLTLIVGFQVAFKVLCPLLIPSPISSFGLLPFAMLAFIVAQGAVGGACEQAWQALVAKNNKDNR